MPENKKHHYVPRFYLKGFSPDKKRICLFNLKSQKFVNLTGLANQCYKDYLYGKEPTTEKALGDLEGRIGQIISRIISSSSLMKVPSEEYADLLLHINAQHGRTVHSVAAHDEMLDQLLKHVYSSKIQRAGLDPEKFKIKFNEGGQYALAMSVIHYPLLTDLNAKLVWIKGVGSFITSDNPVVLYNQMFEFDKAGSNTGFACKGLQIFYPISPKHLILLYDKNVYSVGNKKDQVVIVDSQEDIDQLNLLQMAAAEENVYSMDNSPDFNSLYRRSKKYLKADKSLLTACPAGESEDPRSELLVTSRQDVRTNLTLSFVRQQKRARAWMRDLKGKNSRPVIHVRDQGLVDDHVEFCELVRRGKEKVGDFFKWVVNKYEPKG